jgi:CheY-like chemotaxis protein
MSKKIIIADDNKTFLMYIGILLKRLDFKVMPVENGIEVLKFLKLSEPDLVILDINMKPMDGLTVLKHIKEDKQTSRIPVIMISVDISRETVEKCKDLGCFDYLTKPLKIDKLHNSLERCFFSHMGTNGRHLRADYNKKVEVTYEGKQYELYAENLSERGIFLRRQEPFPVGSQVDVKFYLGSKESIQLKGIIIYTKILFGDYLTLPPGMAIEFKGLTEDNAKALKFYIEDLIAKDILDGQEEKAIER